MPTDEKKAWLVVSGEYSDYGVICAAPTEAIAEAIAARDPSGSARVESVPLAESPEAARGVTIYTVKVYEGGSTERFSCAEWPLFPGDEGPPEHAGVAGEYAFASSTRSYEAAEHAAREKWAERRARERDL